MDKQARLHAQVFMGLDAIPMVQIAGLSVFEQVYDYKHPPNTADTDNPLHGDDHGSEKS